MPPSSSTSGPFSSFPGYGSNNQPGGNSPFSYNAGSGGISTMPWGGNQGSNVGGQNWNSSNWADQASQYFNFPSGGAEGWAQGPGGMWSTVRNGVRYQQDFAPNSAVGMNIGQMVAGEADAQNQRTQQYLQGLQNVYGPAAQSMFADAGQMREMGDQYAQGMMGAANQFMNMANREAYQPVGTEAVDRLTNVVDNNKDLSAQQQASQTRAINQSTANAAMQLADQMASSGASPEQIASQKAQIKAASLPEIQASATQLMGQQQQIQNQLEQNLASFSAQVDFQNESNRQVDDNFRASMAQIGTNLFQQGIQGRTQALLQARMLEDSGNQAMAQLVEANYANGPVSFLSSLMTAANLMYNSPLGMKKDFATRLTGGGIPGLPGQYGVPA